jgi:two-component system sensor histidine kinase KdpD
VLLILLDNALKYSRGPVQVTAEVAAGQVAIAVHDDGPGIPPEKLQRVFDRFYRGEVDPEIPGFGLGLSIARSLTEGQGGTITVISEPGAGSIVRIFLPRAA